MDDNNANNNNVKKNESGKDYSLSKITRETGCDPKLANMLYDFTHGDEQGVIRILSAVPKNILVIKGKFIAQKRKIFGLFIAYYDKNNSDIARIVGAVSTDRDVSRQDVRTDHEELERFIDNYFKHQQSNLWDANESESLLAKVKEILNAEYWPKMIKEARKEELEREMIKALDRSLIRFLNDNQLAIKLDIDNINEFQFAKAVHILEEDQDQEEQDAQESTEESKEKKEKKEEQKNFMMLQCEAEVSPVSGIEASKLNKGDEIFVRITDSRDIAAYLKTLLSGQTDLEKNVPIIAKIVNIEPTETQNIRLFVQFGPGILGQIVTQKEVKVQKKGIVARKKQLKQEQNNNWIFFGFVLASFILLGIIVVLIYLNN